jgi:hypothetical protein
MLKKKVASLDEEVKSDYVEASKKAVMDYILLDSEEKKRLDISVIKLIFNILFIQNFRSDRNYGSRKW